MHVSFFFCLFCWFTSKHPLASPLWQSYTLAFTWKKKSKNLSLLVVKEREEGGLTGCGYTAVPHTSLLSRVAPEVQAEITDRFAMHCWHHLRDLPHSLFFSHSELNLDLLTVVSSISRGMGGAVWKRKLPRMISMSLSRHNWNVFACRKALWLAHRERTTL